MWVRGVDIDTVCWPNRAELGTAVLYAMVTGEASDLSESVLGKGQCDLSVYVQRGSGVQHRAGEPPQSNGMAHKPQSVTVQIRTLPFSQCQSGASG